MSEPRQRAASRWNTATTLFAAVLAFIVVGDTTAHADDKKRPAPPEPEQVITPTPQPMLKAPSPGNSEPGSPVRGYIYGPPPDSGSITDRLVPPSTVRR